MENIFLASLSRHDNNELGKSLSGMAGGRAHIGPSVGPLTFDPEAVRHRLAYLHKNFCRDPFGWKTFFCGDWCRQLFSSIFSSAQHACSNLYSSWEELCETESENIPHLFLSGRPSKEYINIQASLLPAVADSSSCGEKLIIDFCLRCDQYLLGGDAYAEQPAKNYLFLPNVWVFRPSVHAYWSHFTRTTADAWFCGYHSISICHMCMVGAFDKSIFQYF